MATLHMRERSLTYRRNSMAALGRVTLNDAKLCVTNSMRDVYFTVRPHMKIVISLALTLVSSWPLYAADGNSALPIIFAKNFQISAGSAPDPDFGPDETIYSTTVRFGVAADGHKPILTIIENNDVEPDYSGFAIKNPDWFEYGLVPSNGNQNRGIYKIYYRKMELGALLLLAIPKSP